MVIFGPTVMLPQYVQTILGFSATQSGLLVLLRAFVSLSVQLGGSIASTVLVTVFDRRTFFHSDIYRGALTLHSPQVQHLLTLPHALRRLSALVQQQAASAGFADAIFALVPVAVTAVLVCLLLRVPRRRAAVPMAVVAAE